MDTDVNRLARIKTEIVGLQKVNSFFVHLVIFIEHRRPRSSNHCHGWFAIQLRERSSSEDNSLMAVSHVMGLSETLTQCCFNVGPSSQTIVTTLGHCIVFAGRPSHTKR